MHTKNRLTRKWTFFVVALTACGPAFGADSVSLDRVRGNWPEAELSAALASKGSTSVEQGSELALRIQGSQEAHLAVLLQSSEGKVRVLVPRRAGTQDRLVPGTEMLFPDLPSGEAFYADMPVGKASLYIVATGKPVFTDIRWTTGDPPPWIDAKLVLATLENATADQCAIVRLPLQVMSPSTAEFVSTDEFVKFYSVGTRSVKNADRGFRIGFKLNSADLDDWSRQQLDAVGKGMADSRLSNYSFAIEGHTDDTGSSDYNLELSERRAGTVRDFLARQMGVRPERLRIKGYGMNKPEVSGESEAARSQNRRVVIRRLDEAASP